MLAARRHERCLNCGHETPDAFCGACGQRNADLHASLGEIVVDLLEEAFEADSRIARTVGPFFLRPGFLTNEHNAGRRVRYSSPLRLYLFCSFAYFLGLAFIETPAPGDAGSSIQVQVDEPGPSKKTPAFLGRFEQRALEIQKLPPERRAEAKRRIRSEFVSDLPKAVFVLVPLFAALLKLFFWRTRKFYVEHLTFAFHLHAFAFLILLADLAGGAALGGRGAFTAAAFVLILAYTLLALRRVYGQGWGITVAKTVVLAALYSVLLSLAIGAAAYAGLMLA